MIFVYQLNTNAMVTNGITMSVGRNSFVIVANSVMVIQHYELVQCRVLVQTAVSTSACFLL